MSTPTTLWYDQHGAGNAMVVLHPGGAGVDSRAMEPQVAALAEAFRVYTPEQRGHGRTADVSGPISYAAMAADTIAFIDREIGGPVHLLGCSDGAVIALTIALRRPDLVRRLVLVAGIFHHAGWHDGVLDGEPPEFLHDSYNELSPDGPEHYATIVAKLAAMHADQPAFTVTDLGAVASRTLVMVADDDEVRLEHALEMYRGISEAELAIIPGTSHGLLVEKPELCNQVITQFLTQDPVMTYAPIRRADL
jgi:pimeloyl-ACP methyl ester carboxylesterase